jgi:hypothetical protein
LVKIDKESLSGLVSSWSFTLDGEDSYLIINQQKIRLNEIISIAISLIFNNPILKNYHDSRIDFVRRIKKFYRHRKEKDRKADIKRCSLKVELGSTTIMGSDFFEILFNLILNEEVRKIVEVNNFYRSIIKTKRKESIGTC